jgi:5-methylcytosine-specific restriction endonuclease McrA
MQNLKPQLATLPPILGYAPNDEAAQSRYRDDTQPWRRWYKTSRWQQLRWSVLVRDCFRCQRCGHVTPSAQLVCDHIKPHRGNAKAFWSGPFQTLCAECHNSAKQREERAERMAGGRVSPQNGPPG